MTISCDVYIDGRRHLEPSPLAEAVPAVAANCGFMWVDLHRPSPDELAEVTSQLGVPTLAVDDSAKTHTRPKLEVHTDIVVIVLKTIQYVDSEKIAVSGEISFVLNPTFIVSIRQDDSAVLSEVRRALDVIPDEVKTIGPVSVLSLGAILIVEGYEDAIERINTDIDALETEVFSPGENDHAESIYRMKRQIADFRRAAVPFAQGLDELVETDVKALDSLPDKYFQEVLQRALRSAEAVEGFDRLLNDIMQANVARVSAGQSRTALRQNEDTRKISAWAAIALVPTMVTGIYGMNFENMPELHWAYGYPAVVLAIVVFCVVLHRLFVRNGWL